MKLCRFQSGQKVAYGIIDNDTVIEITGSPFENYAMTASTYPLSAVKLLVPVIPPTFYAAGINYREHVTEMAKRRGACELEEAPVAAEDSTLPAHGSPDRHHGQPAHAASLRIQSSSDLAPQARSASAQRSADPFENPSRAGREDLDPSPRRPVPSLDQEVSVTEDICARYRWATRHMDCLRHPLRPIAGPGEIGGNS